MKTIVTHLNPDQDAVFSVWMVKRFFPGFQSAEVKFVPAGQTLDHLPPDQNADIIHVDTGLGKFDHHQTSDRSTCSAVQAARHIRQSGLVTGQIELEALERIAAVVLEVDQALDKVWPEPTSDRYEFFLEPMLEGLKTARPRFSDERLIEFGLSAGDGIFSKMKQKIIAAGLLKEGIKFPTPWGKGIGLETSVGAVLDLGEKQGFAVVVTKDPKRGFIKIYAHPSIEIDLTAAHDRIISQDPQSDWFLHSSKHLLLNGSSKNPKMKPSPLSLNQIIEILKGGATG